MAGKRFYSGDHDDSIVPGLAYGDGRKTEDQAGSVEVIAMNYVEGVLPGAKVTVGEKRATWLIANGYATRPEDFKGEVKEAAQEPAV